MEFIDPPPEKRGQRSQRWIDVVRELKNNPREWAKVGTYTPGVATNIRRGNYKMFLPPDSDLSQGEKAAYMKKHWEVTTRKTSDQKKNDVFIRWLG